MNTHVTFTIAKLLKEKGFDEKCSHYYIDDFQNFKSDSVLHKCGLLDDNKNENILQFVKRKNQPHICNAPTITQVIMWLSEQHIDLCHIVHYENGVRTYRMGIIYIEDNKIESVFIRPKNDKMKFVEFNSPTEAYSAAIEYCLTKLI